MYETFSLLFFFFLFVYLLLMFFFFSQFLFYFPFFLVLCNLYKFWFGSNYVFRLFQANGKVTLVNLSLMLSILVLEAQILDLWWWQKHWNRTPLDPMSTLCPILMGHIWQRLWRSVDEYIWFWLLEYSDNYKYFFG